MALAAERGLVWIRHWRGVETVVGCQNQIVGSVLFPPGTRIKFLRTPQKAFFDLKLMVGGGYHKVVLD